MYMRVDSGTNTRVFFGNTISQDRQNTNAEKKTGVQNGNVFAGNLHMVQDNILQKKQQVMADAAKIVSNAHGNEKEIDDDILKRRDHIKCLQEESDEANKGINEYKELTEQAKEKYGIADDSQEQQDLELLIKQKQSMRPGSEITLTKDEQKSLSEMGEKTEYQKVALEYDNVMDTYKEKISKNQRKVGSETATITAIQIERLKHHAMIDAEKKADELMDAAAKELAGMYVDEAKEKLDEEREEIKEEAEEKADEKKELEEKIEQAKENNASEIPTDNQTVNGQMQTNTSETTANMTDLESEIKRVIEEGKLIEEDLKGLEVDAKC